MRNNKRDKIQYEKKPKNNKTFVRLDEIVPLVLLFLVFPLAELPVMVRNRFAGFDFAPDNALQYDQFLVVKALLLIIIAIWLTIIVVIRYRKTLLYKELFPGAFLFFLLLISLIFSVNKDTSIFGANELFEPFPVLLSYILIFYGVGILINHDSVHRNEKLLLILRSTFISTVIISVIGITEAFQGKMVASTLYNSDYAGSFAAILLPVYAAVIIGFRDRKSGKTWKLLVISSIMLVIFLILSGSYAGMAGAAAGIPIGIIMVLYSGTETGKKAIFRIFTAGAVIILVLAVLLWRNSYIHSEYEDFDLKTGGRYAEFSYSNEKILIRADFDETGEADFTLINENGNDIPYAGDPEENTIFAALPENSRFYGFHFNPMELKGGKRGFFVHVLDRDFYFGNDTDGNCHVLNAYGKFTDLIKADSSGIFKDSEGCLHGRGYIWDRTIPLIKKYAFTGCGPDAFPFVFPQNDLNKVLLSGLPYEELVLKPHNIYLQVLIQLGIPFLIALLFIIMQILISGICFLGLHNSKGTDQGGSSDGNKGLSRNDETGKVIAAACIASLISFLITGIINDSSLCTTPLAAAVAGTVYFLVISPYHPEEA